MRGDGGAPGVGPWMVERSRRDGVGDEPLPTALGFLDERVHPFGYDIQGPVDCRHAFEPGQVQSIDREVTRILRSMHVQQWSRRLQQEQQEGEQERCRAQVG
jgi:hypothetical protein